MLADSTLPEVIQSAAYVAGRRAGLASLSPAACPYTLNSVEAIEWYRGLQSAAADADRYADAAIRRDRECPWRDRADHDLNLRGRVA